MNHTTILRPLLPTCTVQACIVFFDEVDAIGGARFDDGAGGDNEVQRTMLEIVNQLDGFDSRGNVKVSDKVGMERCSLSAACMLPIRPPQLQPMDACWVD